MRRHDPRHLPDLSPSRAVRRARRIVRNWWGRQPRGRAGLLHGSLGFIVPTSDEDGNTIVGFNAALVYAAQQTLSLSAELLGSTASMGGERFTAIDFAPGVRVRAGDPRVPGRRPALQPDHEPRRIAHSTMRS